MKKCIAWLLAAVMLFALAACGQDSPSDNQESPTPETASTETPEPAGPAEETPEASTTAWEPEQPITIMNYVASGGAMDLATRKFAEIAAKYTDATFVVDNMTGSTGMIAADYVLDQPADGYLIYATTVSYIYAIAASESEAEKYIDGFLWIDNIMADPYCILVPNDSDWTLDSLVESARESRQIWCEPNAGGAKHIAALQMCGVLDIEPQVVPYESGPLAIGAVLGGQGAASVGNPGDTTKYDVRALVVANDGRLEGFDVPTFTELGYDAALDQISMWRGYAVKKGTSPEMIQWFQDLCDQVTADPEWIDYFAAQFVTVKNDTTEAFTATVWSDFEAGIEVLKSAGMIADDYIG